MGNFAGVQHLRNLLSVARNLRALADDTLCEDDRDLYLTAAFALEARAKRMASQLPDETDDPAMDARLHRPVDFLI